MLKEKITADLKTAMLAGDKTTTEMLRSIKAAILHEEVAKGARDTGLPDDQIQVVLAREAKRRTESATMYAQAGHQDRADTELAEKAIIEKYLPQQLSDDELAAIVDEVVAASEDAQMGQIIGAVKAKVGQGAEGARIAAAVKAKLGL